MEQKPKRQRICFRDASNLVILRKFVGDLPPQTLEFGTKKYVYSHTTLKKEYKLHTYVLLSPTILPTPARNPGQPTPA